MLTALVLVMFSLQSFLIQTHVHALVMGNFADAGYAAVSRTPDKAPFDADQCVLCQEFVHSGTYLPPAAVAVLAPSAQVSLLPLVAAPVAIAKITSHIWIGRAPPHA